MDKINVTFSPWELAIVICLIDDTLTEPERRAKATTDYGIHGIERLQNILMCMRLANETR